MKRDYYMHRSGGYAFYYFGNIGTPFKVSMFRACINGLCGYCVTRVPRGASIKRVYIRAALTRGAHRMSWLVGEMKKVNYERCSV